MSRRLTPPPLITPPPLNLIGLSPLNSSGGLPTPHSPPGPLVSANGKLIDPTLVSWQYCSVDAVFLNSHLQPLHKRQ